MNINLDSYRAIAGDDTSIGYAVLNEKGTGLEKADNRKHLTSRNITPLESDSNATVRFSFYNLMASHLNSEQGTNSKLQGFLDSIAKELGIEKHGGELVISNKPLERRTIRAIFAAVDVFTAVEKSNEGDVTNLTAKEQKVMDLFSKANFADDKTDPGDLMRLAAAVKRVKYGDTLAESVTVGGTKVTLAGNKDSATGKIQIKALFGSGIVDVDLNGGFLEGALRKSFENPSKLPKVALQRNLDKLSAMLDDQPLLSPVSVGASRLARALIFAKFPKGLNAELVDQLSPRAMVQIARHAADGSYKKAANVMEAVSMCLGEYNSLTGAKRNLGKCNELGHRIDQNINSAENDAFVEKFLAMEEDKQNRVQFNEKVRVPERPSETMSDEEVNKVLDECGGISMSSILANKFKRSFKVGDKQDKKVEENKVDDVENNKEEDGKVEEKKNDFSREGLGEDDIAACETLFGVELLSFSDVSDIWVEVKGEQTVSLVPGGEAKAEEGKEKAPVGKEAKEKKPSLLGNFFTNLASMFGQPKTFSITTDSLKRMLADDVKCRTLVRLMCNAGENGGNLEQLGKFAPHAKLLYNVLNAMDGMKAVLRHFTPGNEDKALATLKKAVKPFAGEKRERVEMLAANADKFTFDGNQDCVSLLRSFCFYGNERNAQKMIDAAAQLLTLNMETACVPEAVKKLREGLLATFGDLELYREKDEPVLLKDACTVDKTSKIADAIRGKMELAISEKDVKAARSAMADLLQDADTWEMDKRADKPGERLKYSLDKNAAVFARLLCNPGHVKALGQPTERVADMMLSHLKDNLMSDKMRAELRPGNEQRVEKLLLGMVRSPELNKPNPMLGDKSILAAAEEMIETKAAVISRQMQAVTSSMFAQMLSGGGMPDSVDDIKDKFTELSGLFGEINENLDEVQCADEALKFIGKLPAGSTVVDFMDLYAAMPESEVEDVKTRMDNALSLLGQLAEHRSVKVDDLVALKKFYEQDSDVPAPTLETLLVEVALKLPASVSVTNFLKLIDVAYPQSEAEVQLQDGAEAQPGPSAQEKITAVLNVITLAAQYGVDAHEAIVLGKVLEKQRPAEGEAKVELGNFLRTVSADAKFSTANFMTFFDSTETGNGNVVNTLGCMGKLRAGTSAADVLDYMKKNQTDFQSAVNIVQNLPASRTLNDVATVMGKLRAAKIDCTDVRVMQALQYFDEPADKVGEALVTIMSEAGFAKETKVEGGNPVVKLRRNLDLEGAVHLLHYLAYDGSGSKRTNMFDNRLKMLDNFKFVAEERQAPGAPSVSTGEERLLFMVLSKLSSDIVWMEGTGTVLDYDLPGIEAEITRLVEAGGEGSSEKPIPMGEILRRAVDLLPKARPFNVKGNEGGGNGGGNEESSAWVKEASFKVVKLNTPPFNPDNGDKFPNLVQRLRMNGMNAEADEIDVAIEMDGEETDGTKAEAVEARQAQLEKRRLELSRMLLDKMSASATDPTKGYGQFMCKVMNRYFGSLDTVDARTMLASACRYSEGGNPVQMLGAMLKGAGPIMQKILQGLASIEELPKDFLAALEDMRSNLTDIPQTVVRAQLNELVEQSNGLIEKIEIDKALGAASVAQTFFCKMTIKGENEPREVVLKMLRPDAQERVEREKAIFRECAAEVPGMKVTFEGQLAGILEELDLRQEAKNVEVGQVYNKGESDVSSMKLIPGVPILKNVMVVEKAPGTTADRLMKQMGKDIDSVLKPFIDNGVNRGLKDGELDANFVEGDVLGNARRIADAQQKLIRMYEDALVQQKRLVTLAEKWANEGIYNGGFYHGDLHAGNIMLDPVLRDENGKVIEGSGAGGLTVIDFGNATQLTKDQQKAVMRMMMAATQQKTDIFMENFAALMTPEGRAEFNRNRKQGKKLDNIVEGLLNLGNSKDAEKRIFAVLQQLMLEGYEMPAAVYKFSQCTLRLQGTISQMNGVMERVRQAMFDLSKLQVDSGIDPLNNFMGDSGVGDRPLDDVSDITRVYKLESNLGNAKDLSQYLQDEIWRSFERGDYRDKLADPDVFTGNSFNAEKFDLSQIEKMVDRYTAALGADKCRKLRQALNDLKTGMLANTNNPLYLPARNLASARKAYYATVASMSESSGKRTQIQNESNSVKAYRSHRNTYGKNLDFVFEGLRKHKNKFKAYREAQKKTPAERGKDYIDKEFMSCHDWTLTKFNEVKSSAVLSMRKSKPGLELGALSFDKQAKELDDRVIKLDGQDNDIYQRMNKTSCTYMTYSLEGGKVKETPTTSKYQKMDSTVLSGFRREFNDAADSFKEKYIAPLTDELARLIQENVLPEFREKLGNGCTSTFEGSNMTLDKSAQVVPGGTSGLKDFFNAMGEVIGSHLDEDLMKINFSGGAIKFLMSCGYLAKGLPSVVGFISDYGWTLTMGAMGGMEAQIPV